MTTSSEKRVETRERMIYVCAAGHRLRSAELAERCPYCRRKLDGGVIRYFRRLSNAIRKGAATSQS